MYLIINLAFLLFFLFIVSRFISLFKRILSFAVRANEKNNPTNTKSKDMNFDNDSFNWEDNLDDWEDDLEYNLEDDAELDSKHQKYGSSTADFKSKDKADDIREYSPSDNLKTADRSKADSAFSQFEDYTELEKAVIYSEILSPPKSKNKNLY